MADLRFEWDPPKDAANQRKHGIAFDEAQSVFADEYGLLLDDPDHSATEDRFVLVSLSARFRILVVVHAYRAADDLILIISAAERPGPSVPATRNGGSHEARVRFFRGPAQSLRQPAQAVGDDPT